MQRILKAEREGQEQVREGSWAELALVLGRLADRDARRAEKTQREAESAQQGWRRTIGEYLERGRTIQKLQRCLARKERKIKRLQGELAQHRPRKEAPDNGAEGDAGG